MKKLIAILIGLFISISCYACNDNDDCKFGSYCIIAVGQEVGVCLAGMDPGNSNDSNPGVWSDYPHYGKTCEFATDCEQNLQCVKFGNIYGACIIGE